MASSTPVWNPSSKQLLLIKLALIALSLLPLLRLFGDLGPNPPEFVSHHTGTWTFNFLLLTLLVSPLRAWTGAHWLLRLRRNLGVLSFFYALLHVSAFVIFEHQFDITEIAKDVLDRPFITVGFAAFVLMIPLALTSNNRAVAYLGGKRWRELHRMVYAIGILAAIHYLWLSKVTTYFYPLTYTILLILLLGWRAARFMDKSRPPSPPQHDKEQPIQFFKQKPKD